MKNFKFYITAGLIASAAVGFTACNDNLDLGPIDFSASGNYWKNVAHFEQYIDGMHKDCREEAWNHTIIFGEMRSSAYLAALEGVSGDGMTMSYAALAMQNMDEGTPVVTNFGQYYGRIANVNNFIYNIEKSDVFKTDAEIEKKKYMTAVAYGLRAFYYYDLYRVYGGVPLRITPDVIAGELDPNKLYMARADQKEVLAQIKNDLKVSLDNFGDKGAFDYLGRSGGNHKKAWWSKAATECLAADVYLWSAKVDGNTSDLATAKQYLKNVEANYSLGLESNFADVFSTSNKGNKEVIFSIFYNEGEATNSNGSYTYSLATGSNYSGSYNAEGEIMGDALQLTGGGVNQSMEYDFQVFLNYDVEDSRRLATFFPCYRYAAEDADHKNPLLYDTFVRKNIGKINAGGVRVYCGDYAIYRLPWVYLALAEVANYEGNNGDVEKYINLVRERAYGENWGDAYKFTAGDFTKNELAILKEKDKEFVQEGQRWWDVRRMTLTKGGKHLVFCPEGHINYGMNPADDAKIFRSVVEGKSRGITPILDEATEAYKVLWPVDLSTLNADPLMFQTPGYQTAKAK